jgi:hypothetical protein
LKSTPEGLCRDTGPFLPTNFFENTVESSIFSRNRLNVALKNFKEIGQLLPFISNSQVSCPTNGNFFV